MRMYIEGNGESPTAQLLPFWCLQKTHAWCALVLYSTHFGFFKDHRRHWPNNSVTEIGNFQCSPKNLETIVPCTKETFRIPALEVPNRRWSARKLPDLKKSILKWRLSKCFEVLGVSLPQNAHHQVDIRNMQSAGLAGVSSEVGLDDGLLVCT